MNIGVLKGMTLNRVDKIGAESIIFTADNGRKFRLFHEQECCEDVFIESVVGDLADLLDSPILTAEMSCKSSETGLGKGETWTFYKLATAKGYVDIRWFGSSNGYYSESADFTEIKEKDNE